MTISPLDRRSSESIGNERIEAEIAAEVRRIEAWNNTLENAARGLRSPLTPKWIRELANHLVRNRLQVEDARVQALLEAAKEGADFIQWWLTKVPVGFQADVGLQRELLAHIRAAIAAAEEKQVGTPRLPS